MNGVIPTTVCTCTSCVAVAVGNVWMSVILAVLILIAISLDFYHIWIRCKDREARLNRLLHLKKGGEKDGGSGCDCGSPDK